MSGRVHAMMRIHSALRHKQACEAVAVFRAARLSLLRLTTPCTADTLLLSNIFVLKSYDNNYFKYLDLLNKS